MAAGEEENEDLPCRRSEKAEAGAAAAAPGGGLSQAQAAALLTDGYVVVDGLLPAGKLDAVRKEALSFARSGRMPEHKFRFGTALFVKPSIFEADLFDEAAQRELPELAELLLGEALAGPLAERLPELRLAAGPGARSVKLQHNAGAGGCFPLHYDNAGPPSRRALTCVVYMNPGWRPGDGGELELRPFLRPAVLVPPLMGRAALFRSDRVLHRVRPSSAERLCFTVWVDGEAVNGSGDCGLTARHLAAEPGALEAFARSPVQRAVSRAVYAEEYEASLRECMERRPGELEEMLQEHRRHVAQQRAHAQLGPFLGRLGALRAQLEGAAGAEAEGQGPD